MKKKSLLFIVIIFFLLVFSKSVDVYFPVEWQEDPDFTAVIDESISLHEPLFDSRKVEAGMAAGLSAAELYARVKMTVSWNEDSVLQGDTLTLRITAEPVKGDRPTIYSNYGFSVGLGASKRMFGIAGGPWVAGPGIGLDFNININSDTMPPMGPMDWESAKGDDVVDFLSLVPEVEGAKSGKGDPIIGQNGDTLLSPNHKEGNSGSDALGLFDLASLRLSGGLKINDGSIMSDIACSDEYFSGNSFMFKWSERTDTLYYKVYIDSFAPESTIGYVYLKNPIYSVNLWNRMGMQLQSLGLTLASSYWITEDKYEDKGIKWLEPPQQAPWEDRFRAVPIEITGSPLYRPDYEVNWYVTIPYNYWGDYTYDGLPAASCTTNMQFYILNEGDTDVPAGSLRFTIGSDTMYLGIPPLVQYGSEYYDIPYVFDSAGSYYLSVEPNYNRQYEEYCYENNRYADMVKVNHPKKLLRFGFLREDSTILHTDSIIRTTIKTNSDLEEITYRSANHFRASVPGADTILISVLPDTANTDYYITTYNEITVDNAIGGDTVMIPLKKYGEFFCQVADNLMNPLDSATVQLGNLTATTDSNGECSFDKILPLDSPDKYSLKITHPMFFSVDSAVHIGSGDSIAYRLGMESPDSIPPSGTVSKIDGYEMHNGYECTTGQIKLKLTASDNFSGLDFLEIKNQGSSWDTFHFTNPGADTLLFPDWTVPASVSNTFRYYYCRFTDMAGNTSDSIRDSVYLVSEGPAGTFTVIDSITSSSNVRAVVSASDPFLNVEKAFVEGYVYNMPADTISVPIGGSDGTHILHCAYVNEMNIQGTTYTDDAYKTKEGNVTINSGNQFTNSPDVNLLLDGNVPGVNNIDLSGGPALGQYPYLQTFVPHCGEISGISVYINSVTRHSQVALYTDSSDGSSTHMPGHYLGGYTLLSGSNGWCYGNVGNVTVNPTDTYCIVIFTDSLTEVTSQFALESADESNYTEGNLYGSPSKKGLMWYDMACDMGFKIYGAADSVKLSNASNMTSSTTIPFTSNYSWTLGESEGNAFVYAQYKYGGSWKSIVNDGITIDINPPVIDSIDINRGNSFTDEPCCTVRVKYSDDYSDTCTVFINSDSFYVSSFEPVIYHFDDSTSTGTRQLDIYAEDDVNNQSPTESKYIDYDKYGLAFQPKFNNSTNQYIPDRFPTLYMNTAKSITPVMMQYFESFTDSQWIAYQPTVQCTFDIGSYFHLMTVKVLDNYGKTNTRVLSAKVDSTPPSAVSWVSNSDNGTDGNINFSWGGIADDPESGLKELECRLTNVNDTSQYHYYSVAVNLRSKSVTDIDMYKQYNFYVSPVNNAGLAATPEYSPVITVNDNPSACSIVSPSNDSVSTCPVFSVRGADAQTDTTLKFRIDIASDKSFSTIINSFDGRYNTDNWSEIRYLSGDTAYYYTQSSESLFVGNKYYWRATVFDSISSGLTSSIDSFTVSSCSGIMPDYIANIRTLRYIFSNKGIYSNNIRFRLEVPSRASVSSSVYDITGSLVKNIIDSDLTRGGYIFEWRGTNNHNSRLPSGTYFIITTVNDKTYKEKVKIIR